MIVNRQGIICKTVKYGESSLILDIFSPDVGMRSYICGGVRKKKSAKASIMQVMNMVDIVCYDKPANKLYLSRIKEIKFHKIYSHIPFDIVRGTLGIFLIEVSRKSVTQTDDTESTYDFIATKFCELDSRGVVLRDFHIRYLIELARVIGFELQNNRNQMETVFSLREGMFVDSMLNNKRTLEPELSNILSKYLIGSDVSSTKIQRKELINHLIDYYKIHVEGFTDLKSLEVLYTLHD